MTSRFVTTAIVYVVAGMIPPLIAVYVVRVRFIGGVWAATLVGLVAAFAGGMADTVFLPNLPDLVVVGNAVDAGPPLIASVAFTVLFGLVSRSN